MTPTAILCPSTSLFILALVGFTLGVYKFHALQANPYKNAVGLMINSNIWISIEWTNILVSLKIWLPINIWLASVIMAILHWLWWVCFPTNYGRAREAMKMRIENRKEKNKQEQGVKELDIEMGEAAKREATGEVGEEMPLIS
jgi:hypothetical protein